MVPDIATRSYYAATKVTRKYIDFIVHVFPYISKGSAMCDWSPETPDVTVKILVGQFHRLLSLS